MQTFILPQKKNVAFKRIQSRKNHKVNAKIDNDIQGVCCMCVGGQRSEVRGALIACKCRVKSSTQLVNPASLDNPALSLLIQHSAC